jgi:hypothetical protein
MNKDYLMQLSIHCVTEEASAYGSLRDSAVYTSISPEGAELHQVQCNTLIPYICFRIDKPKSTSK